MGTTDSSVCSICGGELIRSEGGDLVCLKCMLELGFEDRAAPRRVSVKRKPAEATGTTLTRGQMREVQRPFSTGDRLGRYHIRELLGSGGTGQVYVAEDTDLHREVALKALSPEMSGDPAALLRFRREARTLAALKHPNVVTVYSVEEAEGIHFITMELVDGITLKEVIEDGALGADRYLMLAAALARAVAAAHDRGIVHRDLKPTNVMLARSGEIKVLDFGLAKSSTSGVEKLSTVTVTETGALQGTVPYMSPEQLEGREIDLRSDVFSLGVMLYEMATGDRPFSGDTAAGTITSILRDSPPPLSQRRPDLPSAVQDIVERCLEKNPLKRYPSAADLAVELERAARGLPLLPNSSAPVSTRGPSSRRSALLGGTLAAALVVAVAMLALSRLPRAREPVSSEPELNGAQASAVATVAPEAPSSTPLPERTRIAETDNEPPADSRSPQSRGVEPAAPTDPRDLRASESPSGSGRFLEPYAIEATLFRRAAAEGQRDQPLESGASVSPGDELYLTLSASRDLYVYVLNEDERGEVYLLFPLGSSELLNPLRRGQPYRLPGTRRSKVLNWQVSSAGGEEHFMVLASPERLDQLEAVLEPVPRAKPRAVAPKPGVSSASSTPRKETLLLEAELDRGPDGTRVRGVGGLTEVEVNAPVRVPSSLFSQVLRLVEGQGSPPDIWIRRFDLTNSERREKEP